MELLERWDRRNQDWATASIRDPDRRTGVGIVAVLGVLHAVAAAIAVVVGEWLVAAVAGVKAQVFLMVALVVWHHARRRTRAAAPWSSAAIPVPSRCDRG